MDQSLSIERLFENKEELSKDQLAFQRRVRMVENLKRELAELSASLQDASFQFNALVIPLREKRYKLLKARIQLLGQLYRSSGIPKRTRQDLLTVVRNECKEYLLQVEDPAVAEIFENCSNQSFHEFLEEEREMYRDFEEFFTFGSLEQGPTEETQYKKIEREKTKAQLKREAREAAKEEAKKRSVKEIYRDLMKVFHPDKEQDGEKKLEKEEISKKITDAYKKEDLLALLQYELQLLHCKEDKVKEVAADKLKIYNEILNEQRIKLEAELYCLKEKNEFIYRGMCTKLSNKEKFLREVSKELRTSNESIQQQLLMLENNPAYLKDFIADYLYALNDLGLDDY